MRRRRVLSSLLLACIICSIISGPTYASDIWTVEDLPVDPWAELEEIQGRGPEASAAPELEESAQLPGLMAVNDRSVMAASSGTDSAADYTWTITSIGSTMYYGPSSTISGSTIQSISAGAQWVFSVDDSSSGMIIGQPVASSGSYCFFANTNPLTIRVATSLNFNSHDYSTIYVNGYISSHLYLLYKNNSIRYSIEPETFQLMVNGSPYGEIMDYGTGFDIELDVESLGGITSLGFYFYYPTYTTSFSQGGTTSKVSLGYWLDASTLSFSTQDVSSGLLASILAWLSNILDAIVSLPGRVASAISNVLQSLFVPSQEDFSTLKANYATLLSERLGFIYQGFEWVVDFATTFLGSMQSAGSYSFTFPGVSVPMNGQTYTIIPETAVSLENGVMAVLRPILGTIISFVSVIAFSNSAFDMVTALISGASYFEYLRSKKKGEDEA